MTSQATVRRHAKRLGYYVHKSQQSKYVPHSNDRGRYMLLSINDVIVLGERFDASLEDIDEFLNRKSGVVVLPPIAAAT